MTETEKAIETLEGLTLCGICTGREEGCKSCDRYNAKVQALKALREQQEREKGCQLKAYRATGLTLEHGFDITNADGTPIDYDALGRKYKDKLCYCDIDGFYIGEDGQLVLMDDCGASVSVDRGDYHILARKPKEGE